MEEITPEISAQIYRIKELYLNLQPHIEKYLNYLDRLTDKNPNDIMAVRMFMETIRSIPIKNLNDQEIIKVLCDYDVDIIFINKMTIAFQNVLEIDFDQVL